MCSIGIRNYLTHGLGRLKDSDGQVDIEYYSYKGYDDKISVSQITISKPSFLNLTFRMS